VEGSPLKVFQLKALLDRILLKPQKSKANKYKE